MGYQDDILKTSIAPIEFSAKIQGERKCERHGLDCCLSLRLDENKNDIKTQTE